MKRILMDNTTDISSWCKILQLVFIACISSFKSIGLYAQSNDSKSETRITKTLVVASHPYPEKSVVNKALQQVIVNMDGIVYRNLETFYGNNIDSIDVEAERKAYSGVDRVVFMYPIHWFNLTPMLKAYFNQVWFQWAPQSLRGKQMLIVVTTGADQKAYSHGGQIGLTIDEILAPMKACANYVGMTYLEPLAFLGVTGADENKVRTYQKQLVERLHNKN